MKHESNLNKKNQKSNLPKFFELIISFFISEEKITNLKNVKKHSIIARIIFFLIVCLVFVSILFWPNISELVRTKFLTSINSHKLSFKSDNKTIKVLILPFNEYNSGISKFKIENAIKNGLSEERDNSNTKIEIILDSKSSPPSTSNEAQLKGESKNADIVISGELDSNGKEFKINIALTRDFSELVPFPLPKKYSSGYKKNLQLSKIMSLDSLDDEKFILYNILGFAELKNGNCVIGENLLIKAINSSSNSKDFPIGGATVSTYSLFCAECFFKTNDTLSALHYLENAIQVNPQNYEARLMKVMFYFSRRKFNDCKDELEILKTINTSEKSVVYFFSGLVNYIIGEDFETAMYDINTSISIDEDDSIPSLSKIMLNIMQGNFNISEDIHEFCKYNEIPSIFNEISSAYLHVLDGKLGNTLKDLAKIKKISKNDSLTTIFNDLASGRKFSKDFYGLNQDSIYYQLDKVSTNAIDNVYNSLLLSLLVKKRSDLSKINNLLTTAINQNPDFKNYFNFNGLSKEEVIKLNNIIAFNKTRLKGCITDYLTLIEISKAYKELGIEFVSEYFKRKAISNNLLAIFELPNEQFDKEEISKFKSEYIYLILLKFFGNYKYTLYEEGRILKSMKYYYLAQKKYEENLLAYPNHYNTIIELGYVNYYRGNYYESIKYYNRMVELKPSYYSGYFNRSCAYFKLNEIQNAKEDIEKSIKLFDNKKDTLDYPKFKDLLFFRETIDNKINSIKLDNFSKLTE